MLFLRDALLYFFCDAPSLATDESRAVYWLLVVINRRSRCSSAAGDTAVIITVLIWLW